ncbi:TrmB family transcriptional regulator [Halococcus sediminicola]|uniref:TrmB family transcriptional regulator n=1 Tax=Halococcus sediminicola TaxID=1264579 RepID=UPI000678B51E|nr:helix-turn-helix domain-containing protein [Halococcus sediminicola]
MTDSSPERTAADAAELFEHLGLSQYEARSYIALLRLGSGTAREISNTTDVPRTRIYDAVESLENWGLVDVQHASPKRFQPVSRETALRIFRREYDLTFSGLSERLAALEPADRSREQPGVWSLTGRDAVDTRVVELIGDAQDDLIFMTVSELLTDDVLDELAAAADRDVSLMVADRTAATHERVAAAVPEVEFVDPPWEWHATPTGRLVMADGETILMSTLDDGTSPTETAIWGTGSQNSLVVVLKAIFAWWLDDPDRFPLSDESE